MHRFTSRLGLLLLPALLLFFSACDSHDHDHDGHAGIDRVLIESRDGNNTVLAEWTSANNAWVTNNLPSLTRTAEAPYGRASWTVRIFEGNQELDLTRLTDADGNRFCGEYSARYLVRSGDEVIFNPAPGTTVDVDGDVREVFHCDHIHVYPRAAGTAEIAIMLWHVDHEDGITTSLPITVEAAE